MLIVLAILVVIGGVVIFYNQKPVSDQILNTSSLKETSAEWESRTDNQANVTVTVTPSDLSPHSNEWKFNIVMNTHSVELNQDMMRVAVLVDDQGTTYIPRNWEGPVSGHHREGVLTFQSITPMPKSIELKISGVGDVERSFVWEL